MTLMLVITLLCGLFAYLQYQQTNITKQDKISSHFVRLGALVTWNDPGWFDGAYVTTVLLPREAAGANSNKLDYNHVRQWIELNGIERLDLSGVKLSDKAFFDFGKSERLQCLTVSVCSITDLRLKQLSRSISLQRLNLAGDGVRLSVYMSVANALPDLDIRVDGILVDDRARQDDPVPSKNSSDTKAL